MNRMFTLALGVLIAVTVTAAATAQTPESTPSQATPSPDANAPGDAKTTPAPATTVLETPAATPAKINPEIERVKDRGLKASAKERADVDKKLDEIEKQIENEAMAKGDAAVAGRIAGEFGVTADALTAERSQFSRGWGELLVAHTLLANAKTPMTIADVFQMRNEGNGWGVIAAGLDLKLGEVVAAVKSEGRVATGLAKGDGKPAVIRAGAALGAGAGTKASGKTAGAKAGVSAGAGIGTGVDLNKGTSK